jgi:methylenetetrahydrofolate reductase (NADPH)
VAQISPLRPNLLAEALASPRFELVPIHGALEAARLLPRGSTVTITSSPRRGNEHTLNIARELQLMGMRVVPHVAARLVRDETHLKALMSGLADLGIREIFVVGGDATAPAGAYSSALDMLRAMARIGHDFADIGVAGYPEGHPLVRREVLSQALREKQHFATYLVTQITFDPEPIGSWLQELRREGIDLPAYIGVPGVVDTGKLFRTSMKIGVGQSLRYLSKNMGLAQRLFRRGGYQPDHLLDGLAPYFDSADLGIAGLHINTFNQVERTEEWRRKKLYGEGVLWQ